MSLRVALAATGLLTGSLLAIPALLGGDSAASAWCGDVAVVLDTIRTVESGGNYAASPNRGGASGAYQYIGSTWNNYGGYAAAYLAPAAVQDARATDDVNAILGEYGDVSYVPVVWYWPVAARDPSQMDVVPMPGAGNRLTVREYQQHWLDVYATKLADAPAIGDCAGVIPTDDGYALPIPRAIIEADPSMLDQPHHDYPAIDLMVPVGTPVYAVRGGTIARIVIWPHNCWREGQCDEPCGVGVSIDGDDGIRYVYCHGSRIGAINVGDPVVAGQLLMWSGDSGRSGAPHLHFEIRVNGARVGPGPLLKRILVRGSDTAGRLGPPTLKRQ